MTDSEEVDSAESGEEEDVTDTLHSKAIAGRSTGSASIQNIGRPDNPELINGSPNPNCKLVDGVYTYFDPSSKNEFTWNRMLQQWRPSKVAGNPVTYDGTSFTYTDTQDGTIFEYDSMKAAWFPKLDEEFMVRYQLSYGLPEGSALPSISELSAEIPKPIKAELPKPSANNTTDKGVKRQATPAHWFEQDDSQNTKVYVSNLPGDITDEEFVEFMSKCGLIMRDLTTGNYRIKLYTDPDGNKKGDGLCTYIKIESVHLALQILDGSEIRGKRISVERAQFQLKGTYDPSKKPKSRKRKEKEKAKKQQEKLFEWRPEKLRGERSKHERTVIVQNGFSPTDFDEDVSLILEYQQDFREEAGKCGNCKKVVLYDRHPDGIIQIHMSTPEEADGVVNLFNNRFFGGRKISAFLWDGHTKYKMEETEAERDKRVSNWEKFISEDEPLKPSKIPKDDDESSPPATPPRVPLANDDDN